MGRKSLAKLLLIACFVPWCVADDRLMARDCGNDRYQDFFERKRQQERMEIERDKGAASARETRLARLKAMRDAERGFKRKPVVDNTRLEMEWLEQQKAAREIEEINRKRFVQTRDELKHKQCKGREIPFLLEYDLQDY